MFARSEYRVKSVPRTVPSSRMYPPERYPEIADEPPLTLKFRFVTGAVRTDCRSQSVPSPYCAGFWYSTGTSAATGSRPRL